MHAIRVVAVGLIAAAALMTATAQAFFDWWAQSTSLHAFVAHLSAISPPLMGVTGIDSVAIGAFVSLCIGVGLLASATFYAPVEHRILMTRNAWALRAGHGDYAQAMKVAYLPRRFH